MRPQAAGTNILQAPADDIGRINLPTAITDGHLQGRRAVAVHAIDDDLDRLPAPALIPVPNHIGYRFVDSQRD